MFKNNLFIKPPLIGIDGYEYYVEGYKSYSHYNYIRPGISSFIKSEHFEVALEISKDYFSQYNAIDFGCADGPLLPSLSKYFNHVLAVDLDPVRIDIASKLSKKLNLQNVDLLCNKDMTFEDLKSNLSANYKILFLLETLEHIGDNNDLYGSKIKFIKELFELIDEDGIIIISVPKMVGISFFLQRIGFTILGIPRDPISFKDLIKASFFNNTDNLEKEWNERHLGFNHVKLEKYLKQNFEILKKKSLHFHVVYMIKK